MLFRSSEADMQDLLRIIDLQPRQTRSSSIDKLAKSFRSSAGRILRLLRTADRLCFEQSGVVLANRFDLEGFAWNAVCSLRADVYLSGGAVISYDRGPASLPDYVLDRAVSINFQYRLPLICIQHRKSFHALARQFPNCAGGLIAVENLHGTVLKLLDLVSSAGVPLFFFGDLHPAGLQLFFRCLRACGTVQPLQMNVETYRDNITYGVPLSADERRELEALTIPGKQEVSDIAESHLQDLRDLKGEMLSTGLGIEQEYIRLSPLSL